MLSCSFGIRHEWHNTSATHPARGGLGKHQRCRWHPFKCLWRLPCSLEMPDWQAISAASHFALEAQQACSDAASDRWKPCPNPAFALQRVTLSRPCSAPCQPKSYAWTLPVTWEVRTPMQAMLCTMPA